MNTEPTVLGSLVHNPPTAPLAGGAIGEGVHLPERDDAGAFLARYKSFTDSLSMSYRQGAQSLGFRAEPKLVPARNPADAPIRCWNLTRCDSIYSWQIIEANMYMFLEGWEEAMKYMRDHGPFIAHWKVP